MKTLDLRLQLPYEEWVLNENFSSLVNKEVSIEEEMLRRRLTQKNFAVRHKSQMVRIAKSKLDALCDYVVTHHNPAVPTYVSELLTLEVEGFLMMSRSLLDILSTSLSIIELLDSNVQSFNKLQRRGDCPSWLKDYVLTNSESSASVPIRQRGWLSFLVSFGGRGQSLRDFVTHRGMAGYQFRQLPFEEGWDIIFQPRNTDQFMLPIKEVVSSIVEGIEDLSRTIALQYGEQSETNDD